MTSMDRYITFQLMLKVCLKTIVPHCCQLFRIGLASCRTRDSGQNILTLPSKQRQSKIIQGSAPLRSPRGVLLPASLPDTSFNWRYHWGRERLPVFISTLPLGLSLWTYQDIPSAQPCKATRPFSVLSSVNRSSVSQPSIFLPSPLI